MGNPFSNLSSDQIFEICTGLVSIGDRAAEYTSALQSAGFKAFQPYEDFFISFAANSDEVDLHHRIHLETVKTRLGKPWPPVYIRPEYHRQDWYKSRLLEELKLKRDRKNRTPEENLSHKYANGESAWRRHIDPCERRLSYLRVNDRYEYEARWARVVEGMKAQVESEIKSSSTGISTQYTFDNGGIYEFYTAVMERDASMLGFIRDSHRSSANSLTFSKSISNDWDLCWVFEIGDSLIQEAVGGIFEPHLEILHQKGRRSTVRSKPGEILQIRYDIIVEGFYSAYRKFKNLDDLEIIVKSHLNIYNLIAPILEFTLAKVMNK